MQKMINCSHLLSLMIQSSFEASRIINCLHSSQQLNKQIKGIQNNVEDPVTEADLRVQDMIIRVIHNEYPLLRIEGEEQQSPAEKDSVCSIQVDKIEIDLSMSSVPIEECVLWIDPLDGTKSFVDGHLNCVTTLIGLCHLGRPLLGVVTQHFNHQMTYQPICYYSHTSHPVHQILPHNLISTPLQIENQTELDMDKIRVVVTSSRFTSQLEQITQVLSAGQVIKEGGCGKKIISVLKREADMYYCHKAGTSRWDTAGPEALLISQGGELTDIKGTSYSYDGEEKGNIRGVVATINKTLHKQTIDRYGQVQALIHNTQ